MPYEFERQSKIHAIKYVQLEPVWLWNWHEGCFRNLATLRIAMHYLKENPELKFTFNSAAHYIWIKRYDQVLFNKIRKIIKRGRWEIAGGWWTEPELFLCSGESLIRQGFYGKRFFKQHFGIDCIVGISPGVDAHPDTLPKILKHLGQFYYAFKRPETSDKPLDSESFVWEASDGSRILATRLTEFHPNFNGNDLGQNSDSHSNDRLLFLTSKANDSASFELDIRNIKNSQNGNNGSQIEFSTILQFFMHLEPVRTNLPIMKKEIQNGARGRFSINMNLKRLSKKCEAQLLATERWNLIAYQLLKIDIQLGAIYRSWENLMLQQSAKVLGGGAIRQGIDDGIRFLNETLSICDREQFSAIRKIAQHIPIENKQGEFIVFNSNPWEVEGPIEFESTEFPETEDFFTDAQATEFTTQSIQRSDLSTEDRRKRVFWDTLPAMGYKTYQWQELNKKREAVLNSNLAVLHIGANWLENQFWRLDFDKKTGNLTRLFDRVNEIELLTQPSGIPRIFQAKCDAPGTEIRRFDNATGQFEKADFAIIETGPVRTTLGITSQYNNSILESHWILYANDPRIEIKLKLDWREKHKILKFCFPLNLNNQRCFCGQPYGQVERAATGEENPFQDWLDISGDLPDSASSIKHYGLSFITVGLMGYSHQENEIRLSVCRSAIYGHYAPAEPEPKVAYEYTDQGLHETSLVLWPHSGNVVPAHIKRMAYELNNPPYVLQDYPHNGYLPKQCSFVEVSESNVIVTVVKKAEDNEDVVLRCYETAGKETEFILKLPYWDLDSKIKIAPFSLNTFRLKIRTGLLKVAESNAMEE